MVSFAPASMTVINFIGWMFLPDRIAQQALVFFHSFLRSRGRPTPQKNTPEYVTHWRRMYAFIITCYLVYTIIDGISRTPPNFYEILNVRKDADGNELKTAFRTFARRNHPDRVGQQGAPLFIAVRDAYEALKDPLKRFAYDRFGQDALRWKETTLIDILYTGVKAQLGFYIVTTAFLLFNSLVGQPSPINFWRYFILLTLFTFEMQLLVMPSLISPPLRLLMHFFPRRAIYQHILFLHQLYVSSILALTRVFAVLFAPTIMETNDPAAIRGASERVAQIVREHDLQISALLMHELDALRIPVERFEVFTSTTGAAASTSSPSTLPLDQDTLDLIEKEVESVVIVRTLTSHPAIRPTWDAALLRVQQRREGREKAAANGDTDAIGNGVPLTAENLDEAGFGTPSPALQSSPFRFLSPESDDGRSPRRPSVKRRRTRSRSPSVTLE